MADETDVTDETTDETDETTTDETTDDSLDDTETDDTELTMQDELIEDLTVELEISDVNFSASLLEVKVKGAIRDVKRARAYPSYYTDDQIETDMEQFYMNCRNIALYDYNKVGVDFQSSHNENSVTSSYTEREKLFAGIIPLSR